ncbi:MAG TPA: acyl-CoA dehydrogenase [Chloroflexi bacterium]|nr:acyl-CoA dehydrogenase [Chloroflexota bacterium]
MDFELSEEHRLVRDTVRKLAREKVAPRAAEIDWSGTYPEDIFQLFKEQGLLGLVFPEEYGGSGLGTLALCVAVEEVAKVCSNSALILLLTRLPTMPIQLAGSRSQKSYWLRGVAEGRFRGAFALTEPEAGSDVAAIRTTAVRDGKAYVLNGTKRFITGATVADFIIVFAKTAPDAGSAGISCFLVEKGTAGLAIGKADQKMGMRGIPTTEVILENCCIPYENRVGREHDGFKIAMQSLATVRPIVGARGLGLAEGALDYAIAYAKMRHTFGKPIAEHQGLQFMMADLVTRIEAARWLVYHAAWLVDRRGYDRDHTPYLSIAKAFATDMAVAASSDCLQILGGTGYMDGVLTERFYRDAKQLQLVEGTNQIHRLIIARGLLEGIFQYG